MPTIRPWDADPFVAPSPGSTLPVSPRNGCGTTRPTGTIMPQP
ncbi:hypothetical protein [Acetobacter aceti]|nr:hypothetical protein [Acetobacter aceti]